MTDEEIISAVRNRTHFLVPRGGDWELGEFSLDMWEQFEGRQGLMIELTKEQCRSVDLP